MLVLVTTTDTLRVITSAVCDVDAVVSHMDCSQASPPVMDQPETTVTNITTAATTTIAAAPGGTKRRNIKSINLRNAHATNPVDVTVTLERSSTSYELIKVTLLAGETLEYVEGVGFFKVATLVSSPAAAYNVSLASQAPAVTDTYLTGSNVLISGRSKVGTILRWNVHATKTAAGAATPIWIVRFGTAGAIGDTARCTITGPVQTGVVDNAVFAVEAVVWTAGASGVVRAQMSLTHSATVAAGFGECFGGVTSSAFDLTVAGLQAGLSVTPGASAAWTVNLVTSEAFNLT
jgi:hypothetical protein